MNKYPVANVAGVFRKLLSDDWLVQSYGGGMPYVQRGIVLRSSPRDPIYSYGHNYRKFKKDFSLFMWTTEKDKDKVSSYFDSVVKDLTKEQITKVLDKSERFSYVDKEYK